jgi:hypothetical protein
MIKTPPKFAIANHFAIGNLPSSLQDNLTEVTLRYVLTLSPASQGVRTAYFMVTDRQSVNQYNFFMVNKTFKEHLNINNYGVINIYFLIFKDR